MRVPRGTRKPSKDSDMEQANPLNHYNNPMFCTPTTYEDLLEWCENLNGSEKVVALTAAHMALNFARHLLLQDK